MYEKSPLLEVKELEKKYYKSNWMTKPSVFQAVKPISFSLYSGECLGLVGESGCGKSTLAKTLVYLDPATSGEIFWKGEKIKPKVLICDESVAALDISVQAQVLNLLNDLKQSLGLSYLFISHDLAVVKYMSDRVMVMEEGTLVELQEADTLYQKPQKAYTQKLIDAIP
jgi:ABC-type oligopeptide transport system ATPase subunit